MPRISKYKAPIYSKLSVNTLAVIYSYQWRVSLGALYLVSVQKRREEWGWWLGKWMNAQLTAPGSHDGANWNDCPCSTTVWNTQILHLKRLQTSGTKQAKVDLATFKVDWCLVFGWMSELCVCVYIWYGWVGMDVLISACSCLCVDMCMLMCVCWGVCMFMCVQSCRGQRSTLGVVAKEAVILVFICFSDLFIFIQFIWVCACIYVCTMYMPGAWGGQKRVWIL